MENLENFDDFMVCDDNCIDNGVDVRREKNNQSITVELPLVAVTEEIPPKYDDTSCSGVLSTFASPKSKKRKLPSFDELLENLHSDVLIMNFTNLLLFLESKNKEMTFPFILKEYEEFFEIIVQDISILKSKSLDANYRDICDKILEAATGYLLTCSYEYRQTFQKIVMVINKEHNIKMDKSENGMFSFSCSTESVMPTASEVDSNEVLSRSPSPGPISSGFIIHYLRTTLAFIKNDVTKTKEFPELNLEQTQFMHLLLESVIAFTEFDSHLEMKELYRAFWEAVRIYSLKYEFKIKCVESCGGKNYRSLMFEKVPKKKPPLTVNSNQIMNQNTDVLKTETSKLETPKPDAPKPETLKTEAPKPEASKTEAPEPEATITDASKTETRIPEAKKSEAFKTETPIPETPIPEALKSETSIPEALKSETPIPETLIPEASKSETPIPETQRPEASKSEVPKPEKFLFPMPEIPKVMPCVNPKPLRVTKRMLNSRQEMENENLFIKSLPKKLISDTLNTIYEFLLDEERLKLVFLPNSPSELDFYRKCLSWCRPTFTVSKFGDEFQEMHDQISFLLFRVKCTVNKGRASMINETTGIKEVTYIKTPKNVGIVSLTDPVQSAPKKKKVNLQNALQLAGTDNIKLASVINLNQSLRTKKKDKKLKKAKLKAKDNAGASKKASVKQTNQAKTWTDGSSSTCSSRGTSRDRSKASARAQRVAKRALNENNQSARKAFRERSRSRRGEETIRKEQLKEALSVPVQSDKAMRMMRGMGWSGGALGARGNGITEPLMPPLDLARGAGLGHSRYPHSEKIVKKPRESKTAPSFVSENSHVTTENDIIVQKTKQLLLENSFFDSIMKVIEPEKSKESNVELPTRTTSNVELLKPIKPNVESPKPTTCNAKQHLKLLPTLTKFSNELQKPDISDLKFPLPFRQKVLHSILELLNSDATSKILKYENKLCKKAKKFMKNVEEALKSGMINHYIFQKEEHDISRQIQDKYKRLQVVIEILICNDFKTVELIKKELTTKKVSTKFATKPIQQELPNVTQLPVKPNTEVILEEKLYSYIISSGTHFESEKAYEALKFKVLFLLNLLSFIKSFNEEAEVTFNKVLNVKQKTYIQNVVDEVNMRIKFGSTPAETKLCAEIKNHVKDAFLGFMFNHEYTVVSLNKYFRFKRLNRPDNAVKRKCQTTVNLDAFSSETFSEPRLNTNKPTDKENNSEVAENNSYVGKSNKKVAENNNAYVAYENNAISLPEGNEIESYNSDNSCVEEYNSWSVPKLHPGEDGVNTSKFLYLYDTEKLNTTGIKNNSNINNRSASKNNSNVTENGNKNNFGNGNFDNNVDTEMAEYVVCLDYTEEVVNTGDITVNMNKEKEVNILGNKKDGEVMVRANNALEIVNQHKEIGIHNIDKMFYEVLSNTEDTIDQNVIVIEDSDSNDCTENIVKDEIQNGDNLSKNDNDSKEDTDVIMIEIDDEPTDVISITEESIDVIDKEESVELINQGESMEEIYSEDLVKVINKVEPSEDVQVAKMEEQNSSNQIVKEDLAIKTDSDILSKEKLVISEDICDTHLVRFSCVKTVGTVTDVPNVHINKDTEIMNVRIVHTSHPIRNLTNEEVSDIQRHISNRIMLTTHLPLLKCHGVQNGALIYSCHNKKTYDWLQNTTSVASYVKVLNAKEITKMALKFYCFFDFDTGDLFRMIELYNRELSTKDWIVENTEKDGDYIIFIVKMDKFSIKFILESNLALFAGIDQVQFILVWE